MQVQSFNTVRRVVFGVGALQSIGEEITRLGGSRVLVVTDPGIKAAGLVDKLTTVLQRADLPHHVFAEVEPDPRVEVVAQSVAAAKAFDPDIVVGLGGGSALDISKVTAVMLTNDGSVEDYFGMELVPSPGLPLVLVPTTAGTGSEMTSICVLSDTKNDVKKGVVSEHMYARVALLDPDLTVGLPQHVTATTGMDAFVHAMESYTGVRASFLTDTLNLQAIRMIAGNLRRAYANGDDLEARTQMLQASCVAGMAFSNTQNGLDHALALAIGGRFHLPHGLLTAFICPWVMAFNLMACPDKFIKIAEAFGENTAGLPKMEAASLAVKAVKGILSDMGISDRLRDYDVPQEVFPDLAKATVGAARLISNNPRSVSEQDVIRLLETNY
ncbi:MAG: iron-containing alcohol dehydrogenase [Desulfosarcinaceae bacterium]|nr:iron-containing alcohol dehydrogenase [Desulfosarcinaceae bacterium]